jgi:hypothetical protein
MSLFYHAVTFSAHSFLCGVALRKIVSLFLTANILFSLGQVFAVNSVSSDDGASLFENVGIHYYSKDEGSRIVTMCA